MRARGACACNKSGPKQPAWIRVVDWLGRGAHGHDGGLVRGLCMHVIHAAGECTHNPHARCHPRSTFDDCCFACLVERTHICGKARLSWQLLCNLGVSAGDSSLFLSNVFCETDSPYHRWVPGPEYVENWQALETELCPETSLMRWH